MPSQWKYGIMARIFKGGSRLGPKNYRPVTLTSHIVKSFEIFVINRMVDYIEIKELHNESQDVFKK